MSDIRSSKAQNLARIRDNQRRSRARRKEYLQELEAKLRTCEQAGIEASSEIQSAARKVLDENKKLRALLNERGVSDHEVNTILGGPCERSHEQMSPAVTLNVLLERRITCNMAPPTSCTSPSQTRAASLPRQMPSVPLISIPAHRSTALSSCDSPSPSSIVSSMGTPPPPAYSSQLYATPSTPAVAEIKAEEVQYNYLYDQPYDNSWSFVNDYNYSTNPNTYYNTSSSVDAANIIRTMRTDVPKSEPVYQYSDSPQRCYNNNVGFDASNRYSSQYVAM